MGLFYPSVFGIVGQKMTSLQYRSQGDPEDPHDEHYLMATQSKQDQVTQDLDPFLCSSNHPDGIRFLREMLVPSSPLNLQSGKLFPG